MTVWIGTRLVYYPFWVIHSTVFDAPRMIQENYRYDLIFQRPIIPRILVTMLCTLVFLHIFWTYVLIKIAVQSAQSGALDDIREDSDEEFEDEGTKKLQKKRE